MDDNKNEEIMMYIATMYKKKKQLLKEKPQNKHDYIFDHDLEFVEYIDRLVTMLPQDYEKIIRNDFLQERNKKWWQEYFKKSTYYRRKSEAIAVFVDCVTL